MKMHLFKTVFLLSTVLILSNQTYSQQESQETQEKAILINSKLNEIELNPDLMEVLRESVKLNDETKKSNINLVLDPTKLNGGYLKIPEEFKKCIDSLNAPKTIKDLTRGLTLDSYRFDKENQAKLGFLGFGNVEIMDKETVIVVEYKQTGTQRCDDFNLFYGIGARLMMHIRENKRSAKVNTPQQISASVVFGKADVTFSIKTFGITGPGVAQLVKAGTLNEDTYIEFLNQISNLIVDIYKQESAFIVDPQPLFLKQ
jgi:hypothetical protein